MGVAEPHKQDNQRSKYAVPPEVIRRARRGDKQAFGEMYQVFAKPCYNLALRIARSPAVAEDIVHDTFIKIIQRLKSYRGDAPLWAWVRQVTVNTALNDLQKRKWLVPVEHPEDMRLDEPISNAPAGAVQHDLDQILGTLSIQARTVLLLHDMEGMTHKEIALHFNQTESFSKSVLFRARKQLSRQLEDSGAHSLNTKGNSHE